MASYSKYATITIPPGVPVMRTNDWTPAKFVIPVEVRAKMPCFKDGRPKGSKPMWVFILHNYAHGLEMSQEANVQIGDVKIIKRLKGSI